MSHGKLHIFDKQSLFSAREKRNIFIYILGIMLYKFGVEAFNGAIITLATNRYDQDAHRTATSTNTFERVGLLVGVNQIAQCFGSILIGPLVKRWRTQIILSTSIFLFALSISIFMIIDFTTGGTMKPRDFIAEHRSDFRYYGQYRTDIIIPIHFLTGIAFGIVESIRRIIPANIAGDHLVKLRKMDALVHIFYEIAGVSGALMTALVLIPYLGDNYAFILTPILFFVSGIIWLLIRFVPSESPDATNELELNSDPKSHLLKELAKSVQCFVQSILTGVKIIFTERKYIWLFAVYPLALYSHRFIENTVTSQVARRYLHYADWSQILVGGSNFGELLGAIFVYCFNDTMKSPMLWVRLDALFLLVIWYIPFYYPPAQQMKYAWIMAATLIPIGFASAIDNISLDSYIQSSLARLERKNKNICPLGAVMAFLYSTYIAIYSIANPFLGRYTDLIYNQTDGVHSALIYTAGVQLTIIFIIMFVASFIPKGAVAFNPVLSVDIDDEVELKDTGEKIYVSTQTSTNSETNQKLEI